MALTARFLVDTSAAARMNRPKVAEVVGPMIESGLVATTAVRDAEAFYCARSPAEFARMTTRRIAAFEYLPTDDAHWRSALDAQFDLAQSGRHRSVGIADVLTAVLAQAHGLTILHYDSDFDTAATVLSFQHRWVAPPATL